MTHTELALSKLKEVEWKFKLSDRHDQQRIVLKSPPACGCSSQGEEECEYEERDYRYTI